MSRLEAVLRETAAGKAWERRGTEPGALRPVPVLPCRMVYSLARHKGRAINVRCECMAQTLGRPSPRYFNYDPIAEVSSLDEAARVWEAHRNDRAA